ncbi:MAG: hypothetical protein DSM106950_09070 [Stigonema ocellatum SAG 48.90 = DSM 106950]|nr:hypothetical protein [Stigonema ocellatum SAG 48.90 = DSM 106950]
MNNIQLDPCPYCQHQEFDYGFCIVSFIEELMYLKGIKNFQEDKIEQNVSKIIKNSSLGGFLGIYKSFKGAVFDGVKSTPLLICKHCRHFIVVCPICKKLSLVERYVKTGEMVECMYCKAGFLTSESGSVPI